MNAMPDKPRLGTELLDHLADILAGLLVESLDLDRDTAAAIGDQAAVLMSDQWGGAQIYIPTGRTAKALAFHANLYAAFQRNPNPETIRRQFGVSLKTVYQVVRQMRKAEIDAKQHDLFRGAA
jgi:Mor family transcriptional regulator